MHGVVFRMQFTMVHTYIVHERSMSRMYIRITFSMQPLCCGPHGLFMNLDMLHENAHVHPKACVPRQVKWITVFIKRGINVFFF